MGNRPKALEEHAQLLENGEIKSMPDISTATKIQDTLLTLLAGFASVSWREVILAQNCYQQMLKNCLVSALNHTELT